MRSCSLAGSWRRRIHRALVKMKNQRLPLHLRLVLNLHRRRRAPRRPRRPSPLRCRRVARRSAGGARARALRLAVGFERGGGRRELLPVRNDIAGTLGRMQPRCQQYLGGSPRSRTTSAPSCVGWAQRSCACAQPSPAGSPSIPTRPCACPCSLATTSKTLPAISARVNGNFGSGIWACGLHNHTRAPCDSKATPSGGPEKVRR